MAEPSDPRLLQREYRERGFLFRRGFFDRTEIAELVREIRAVAAQRSDADVLDVGNLRFHAGLMHKSEPLRRFLAQEKIVAFLRPFVGPDIWVRWDQAVEKRPGAGTFPWHQDNSYSGLVDAHFQFWISLTRMTKDNGGIWLIPGSHRRRLPHRLVGHHTVHEPARGTPEFIGADVGDVVLFSSLLLHSTTPNVTAESRWAYVIEYMRGRDVDPFVEPPYLIVAANGKPAPGYVDRMPGERRLWNRLKYWRAHWRGTTQAARRARGESS